MVRGARPGEERRAEAVLRQRPRPEAGCVRGVDEGDAASADLRLRRRHPRRARAESRDSRRIVGADSSARSARHRSELRRRCESRIAARLGRHHRARRHDVHGVARGKPAAVLPPRIVRQVHAVPRGHAVGAQHSREDRARRRRDEGSRVARERRRPDCRQDALRVRRRCRDAGADDAEEFPWRVRGPHPRGALHRARALAAPPRGAGGVCTRTLDLDSGFLHPSPSRSSRFWASCSSCC